MNNIVNTHNAFFRQLLFLSLLIATGLIIFDQLIFFTGSFLGAISIYVVVRTTQFKLTEKYGWKPWIASLLLVIATTLLLLGMGFGIFEMLASEISNIDTSHLIPAFNELTDKANRFLGFKAAVPETIIKESSSILTKIAASIFNTTYSFIANIFMMLIILFFMLTNARRMEQKIFNYIPFRNQSLDILKTETKNIIFSNAVGIPIVMLSQGAVSFLIYWLLGVNNALFWGFMTAIAGLLPMVGTVIVSAPLGIYLIANGIIWQGIVLIACGLLIIANIDNLCRIILMKKVSNTHPLIVIFGVILGIPLFGFWGIIFGPLLISLFLLLIKIYYVEYKLFTPEKPE